MLRQTCKTLTCLPEYWFAQQIWKVFWISSKWLWSISPVFLFMNCNWSGANCNWFGAALRKSAPAHSSRPALQRGARYSKIRNYQPLEHGSKTGPKQHRIFGSSDCFHVLQLQWKMNGLRLRFSVRKDADFNQLCFVMFLWVDPRDTLVSPRPSRKQRIWK